MSYNDTMKKFKYIKKFSYRKFLNIRQILQILQLVSKIWNATERNIT